MKKLAFGRVNESRRTFQWKHWVPIFPWKQLTGTQEYPLMWSCSLHIAPVSTKHLILLRECFIHLGKLPVPWIHKDLKLLYQKEKKNETWVKPYHKQSQNQWKFNLLHGWHQCHWVQVWIQICRLHSYGGWCDAWNMYCVIFAFIYLQSSKLLVFTFLFIFLGQVHRVRWFAHEIRRHIGKIQAVNNGNYLLRSDKTMCVCCRCKSNTVAYKLKTKS